MTTPDSTEDNQRAIYESNEPVSLARTDERLPEQEKGTNKKNELAAGAYVSAGFRARARILCYILGKKNARAARK